GRSREAFEYSDGSRARVLWDAVTRPRDPPFGSQDRSATLPRDLPISNLPETHVLVEYRVLDREVLAWVVRRGSVDLIHLPISRDALNAQVAQVVASLSSSLPDSTRLLSSLHAAVIAPLRDKITGASTLVIVPDRCLSRLPFAALVDARNG